jgi:hypothetical protein
LVLRPDHFGSVIGCGRAAFWVTRRKTGGTMPLDQK